MAVACFLRAKKCTTAGIIIFYENRKEKQSSRTVWPMSNGCVAGSVAGRTWTCRTTLVAVDCRLRSRCSPGRTAHRRNVRLLRASIHLPKCPGILPPSPVWPSRFRGWISCWCFFRCICDPGPAEKYRFINTFARQYIIYKIT